MKRFYILPYFLAAQEHPDAQVQLFSLRTKREARQEAKRLARLGYHTAIYHLSYTFIE
jgi:hypothetical protein